MLLVELIYALINDKVRFDEITATPAGSRERHAGTLPGRCLSTCKVRALFNILPGVTDIVTAVNYLHGLHNLGK